MILLEKISKDDIEILRIWKNKNKKYFFYKDNITKEQQEKWFEEYLKRKDDFIFIINVNYVKAGCIGFRLIDKFIDIYNVIMDDDYKSKGIMSIAFKILYRFIRQRYNNAVTVKVLNNNPAVKWYREIGFRKISKEKDYILMRYK